MTAPSRLMDLAVQHHQAGRLAEALNLYRQLLLLNSTDMLTLYRSGLAAAQLGKHDEAIAAYHRALAAGGEVAEIYNSLGVAYYSSGDLGNAITSLQRAVALKPDYAEARDNLAAISGPPPAAHTQKWTRNLTQHPRATFGDFTYGVPQIRWWGEDVRLTIGKFCSIADGVQIFLGGNHRTDFVSTYPFASLTDHWPLLDDPRTLIATKGDVTIGNDVWLGSQSCILSGVTVGDGAVIGAYTVVARDVPPYAIVVGNPGQVIRTRFDQHTIDRLLALRWWDWPLDRIQAQAHLLSSAKIDELLNGDDRALPRAA